MALIVINLNHSGGNLSLPICKGKNLRRVLKRCRDFYETPARKIHRQLMLPGKLV